MFNKIKLTRILAGIIILIIPVMVFSQINIPLKDQIPIFLKSLNYDKNIADRIEDRVNIAVLYDKDNEISTMTMEKVIDVLKENEKIKIFKKKNLGVSVPYSTKEKLEKKIFINKLHAFFICPGLEDKLGEINEVAAFNRIITMSPSQTDIADGNAVLGVIGTEESFKPYVNLTKAKENNIELDLKLLSISEVLK